MIVPRGIRKIGALLALFSTLHLSFYQSSQALNIDGDLVRHIHACLSQPSNKVCEYPAPEYRDESLVICSPLVWETSTSLILISKQNIVFKPRTQIQSLGGGNLILKAGFNNTRNSWYLDPRTGDVVLDEATRSNIISVGGDTNNHLFSHRSPAGTIIFEDKKNGSYKHIIMKGGGNVAFYDHPAPQTSDDLQASSLARWDNKTFELKQRVSIEPPGQFLAYRLIDHVHELQDINQALHNNYALGQDIDAQETQTWDKGKGFRPLRKVRRDGEVRPFSGHFDGNGFTIRSLYINRPDEDNVGLFGITAGSPTAHHRIKNLVLDKATIIGSHYVGALAGDVHFTSFDNITITASSIKGEAVVGGLVGTANTLRAINLHIASDTTVQGEEYVSHIFGTVHCTQEDRIDGKESDGWRTLITLASKETESSDIWWCHPGVQHDGALHLVCLLSFEYVEAILNPGKKLRPQLKLAEHQCYDEIEICQGETCTSCAALREDNNTFAVRTWRSVSSILIRTMTGAVNGLLYGAALGALQGVVRWGSDIYWERHILGGRLEIIQSHTEPLKETLTEAKSKIEGAIGRLQRYKSGEIQLTDKQLNKVESTLGGSISLIDATEQKLSAKPYKTTYEDELLRLISEAPRKLRSLIFEGPIFFPRSFFLSLPFLSLSVPFLPPLVALSLERLLETPSSMYRLFPDIFSSPYIMTQLPFSNAYVAAGGAATLALLEASLSSYLSTRLLELQRHIPAFYERPRPLLSYMRKTS